ncbi:MAG: hypothetical protein AAF558_08315 [Verrucomicrobiota bacterium]
MKTNIKTPVEWTSEGRYTWKQSPFRWLEALDEDLRNHLEWKRDLDYTERNENRGSKQPGVFLS